MSAAKAPDAALAAQHKAEEIVGRDGAASWEDRALGRIVARAAGQLVRSV